MSKVSKGKRWERKLCSILRDYGYVAERIRGSGGGSGTGAGDILFCHEKDFAGAHANDTRGSSESGNTIGNLLESGDLDPDKVFDGEVKYTSDGYNYLWGEHFKLGGMLSIEEPLVWSGFGDIHSMPLEPLLDPRAAPIGLLSPYIDNEKYKGEIFKKVTTRGLTAGVEKIIRGKDSPGTKKAPDFTFFRHKKKGSLPFDWLVFWVVE